MGAALRCLHESIWLSAAIGFDRVGWYGICARQQKGRRVSCAHSIESSWPDNDERCSGSAVAEPSSDSQRICDLVARSRPLQRHQQQPSPVLSCTHTHTHDAHARTHSHTKRREINMHKRDTQKANTQAPDHTGGRNIERAELSVGKVLLWSLPCFGSLVEVRDRMASCVGLEINIFVVYAEHPVK